MKLSNIHSKEIGILFEIIRNHISFKFGVEINTMDALYERSRKKPIVYFRKLMMVILNDYFIDTYTQKEISEVVGLDRTSLIHHIGAHNNEYSNYADYREDYDKLINEFKSKI